jgi:hypothetical protein
MKLERLGKAGKTLLVIPLILLLGLVLLDPKREGDTHHATMSDLLVQETNKGTKTQIMATLESGRKVVIYGTLEFRDGAEITLQEYVTLVLGRHSYHFVAFEE